MAFKTLYFAAGVASPILIAMLITVARQAAPTIPGQGPGFGAWPGAGRTPGLEEEGDETSALQARQERLTQTRATDEEEQVPGPCFDRIGTAKCLALKGKKLNCMDMPNPYPKNPESYQASLQLQRDCQKTCAYCDNQYAQQEFYLRRIKTNEVENEMSYAREGSPVPETLHGLWWLDQRNVFTEEGTKCEPDFKDKVKLQNPVDEVVVSMGDGLLWNAPGAPAENCLSGAPWGGRQGHWSFFDNTGNGTSQAFDFNYANRFGGYFCFKTATYVEIISNMIPAYSWMVPLYNMIFGKPQEGFYTIPSTFMSFTMRKTCFGWDRITSFGPRWFQNLNPSWAVQHYPAFQIVDGKGNRIKKNYNAYLKFANNDTTCELSSLDCPLNRGGGTILVPTWTGKAITPGHPLGYQLPYLKLTSLFR